MNDILYPARLEHDAFNGQTLIHFGDREIFVIDDEVDTLTHSEERYSELLAQAVNDAHALRAKVARLREALAWYADPEIWVQRYFEDDRQAFVDAGYKARAALGNALPDPLEVTP